MAARSRFLRWTTTLPLGATALLIAALAVPACGGGSSGAANGGNGGAGGSGNCPTECTGTTPICDPDTQTCVGCLPSENTCGAGQFCDPATNTCQSGCSADSDCPAPLVCNVATNQCVTCLADNQCDPGFVCGANGQCVAGCTESQPCSGGLACCNGACTDLAGDVASCGACGVPCPNLPGATEVCTMGMCAMGACDAGFADCNKDASDGCEWDVNVFGDCKCTPGETMECYSGPMGSKGVGTCVAGTTTCTPDGANWGPCEGEVTPVFDACKDGMDNDCDGTPDNAKDLDGDGWSPCDGDCCDIVTAGGCGNPNLVNPGAFEVAGNMVDDDCDKVVDNPLAACDAGLASSSSTATDYAKAIDICASTSANPPLDQKKWGVISASLTLANGMGTPAAGSRSIRTGFGTGVTPLAGSSIAVLSTGGAADQNDTNPGYQAFQNGFNAGTTSAFPADWYAANGNKLPNAPGCPAPTAGTGANDPVMLTVKVRVPTNAKSFSISSNFFSAEYPEYVCTAFNDFFVMLLDSKFVPGAGQVGNPADKNLAFYDPPPAGPPYYPVAVNLALGTGLFNQCLNGQTGCAGTNISSTNQCMGTGQLAGTGFQIASTGCGTNNLVGGGTGWLTTSGNVAPGEEITLRIAIWDTSDHIYDSLVLVDNFKWSLDASTPGTHE